MQIEHSSFCGRFSSLNSASSSMSSSTPAVAWVVFDGVVDDAGAGAGGTAANCVLRPFCCFLLLPFFLFLFVGMDEKGGKNAEKRQSARRRRYSG